MSVCINPYLYVNMYICIHVCRQTYMGICVCKYIKTYYRNKYVCTHLYACLYTPVYLHAYTHMYVHLYMYTYIFMYPCTYVICIYIYVMYRYPCLPTCIHININTLLHATCTHIQTFMCLSIYILKYIHSYMYACNMCLYVNTYTHTCTCMSAYVHVSHRGVFQDNKVSCSCSGHQFFNNWANYQLNFIYFYWASQLLWSSEDGLTVCHMICTQSGLYLYGLHPA